jgi:hypothetical protein
MLLVQRALVRKSLLIAAFALSAFVAVAGGADARSNPEDGEISGPYQYVIRANPAAVSQQVQVAIPGIQVGK